MSVCLKFKAHTDQIWGISFSPCGQYVATACNSNDDGIARLWDLGGNLIASFGGRQGGRFYVRFSPDGSNFLSGANCAEMKFASWNSNVGYAFRAH